MFAIIPLGKKGSSGIPLITIFISVACALVFAFAHDDKAQLALAYYPRSYDVATMFTSVFTHADIWHLVGNLFFFYGFARTVETQISVKGYLFAFVLFVLVTNLAYGFAMHEDIPTIGLSGIVWGYMGIFLFRYPKDYIDCFVWYVVVFKIIEVPALVFILAFLALNVGAYRNLDDSAVNYVAHFSGFAAGALFRLMFWHVFTTEKPEPKRRPATKLGQLRASQARALRR
ncbi:MAG TPA: rhomboid family intramembrane serine protease [Steroidobacteraceae bacterium]|nr:rhomboid family intramembrane serine protease [Steroidobacteraceae bacterium]